jgi:adenylosuccinate synthase
MGVGETAAYALAHPDPPRAGDVRDRSRLRRRLAAVRDRLTAALDLPEVAPLDAVVDAFLAFGAAVSIVDGAVALRRLLDRGPCVFEGAQGVLLDEWYGWHPYTTWSTTTFANAQALLAEAGHQAYRLGVLRTYTTRHGAGPLVTEDPAVTAALPERHNGTGRWQGAFRAGHFDAVAHRYAVEVCGGVDGLAVTHLDAPGHYPGLRLCRGYLLGGRRLTRLAPGVRGDLAYPERLGLRLGGATAILGPAPEDWSTAIGETLGAPVVVESYGPNRTDKFFTAGASRTLQAVG